MADLIATALTAAQTAYELLEQYQDNKETKERLLIELSNVQNALRLVRGAQYSTLAGIQDLLNDSGRTLKDLCEQLKNLPTGIFRTGEAEKRLKDFTDKIRAEREQLIQGYTALTLRATFEIKDEMAHDRKTLIHCANVVDKTLEEQRKFVDEIKSELKTSDQTLLNAIDGIYTRLSSNQKEVNDKLDAAEATRKDLAQLLERFPDLSDFGSKFMMLHDPLDKLVADVRDMRAQQEAIAKCAERTEAILKSQEETLTSIAKGNSQLEGTLNQLKALVESKENRSNLTREDLQTALEEFKKGFSVHLEPAAVTFPDLDMLYQEVRSVRAAVDNLQDCFTDALNSRLADLQAAQSEETKELKSQIDTLVEMMKNINTREDASNTAGQCAAISDMLEKMNTISLDAKLDLEATVDRLRESITTSFEQLVERNAQVSNEQSQILLAQKQMLETIQEQLKTAQASGSVDPEVLTTINTKLERLDKIQDPAVVAQGLEELKKKIEDSSTDSRERFADVLKTINEGNQKVVSDISKSIATLNGTVRGFGTQLDTILKVIRGLEATVPKSEQHTAVVQLRAHFETIQARVDMANQGGPSTATTPAVTRTLLPLQIACRDPLTGATSTDLTNRFLRKTLKERRPVVIVGESGSGKTTVLLSLASVLIKEIDWTKVEAKLQTVASGGDAEEKTSDAKLQYFPLYVDVRLYPTEAHVQEHFPVRTESIMALRKAGLEPLWLLDNAQGITSWSTRGVQALAGLSVLAVPTASYKLMGPDRLLFRLFQNAVYEAVLKPLDSDGAERVFLSSVRLERFKLRPAEKFDEKAYKDAVWPVVGPLIPGYSPMNIVMHAELLRNVEVKADTDVEALRKAVKRLTQRDAKTLIEELLNSRYETAYASQDAAFKNNCQRVDFVKYCHEYCKYFARYRKLPTYINLPGPQIMFAVAAVSVPITLNNNSPTFATSQYRDYYDALVPQDVPATPTTTNASTTRVVETKSTELKVIPNAFSVGRTPDPDFSGVDALKAGSIAFDVAELEHHANKARDPRYFDALVVIAKCTRGRKDNPKDEHFDTWEERVIAGTNAISILNYGGLKWYFPYVFWSDKDWSGLTFRGANLGRAQLLGCNFNGTNLENCNLFQAVVLDTDLSGVDATQLNVGLSRTVAVSPSNQLFKAWLHHRLIEDTAVGLINTGMNDGIIFYNTVTGKAISKTLKIKPSNCIKFTPKGDLAVAQESQVIFYKISGSSASIKLEKCAHATPLPRGGQNMKILSFDISPDGRYIALACEGVTSIRVHIFKSIGASDAKTAYEVQDSLFRLDMKSTPTTVSFTDDGRGVVASGAGVKFWSTTAFAGKDPIPETRSLSERKNSICDTGKGFIAVASPELELEVYSSPDPSGQIKHLRTILLPRKGITRLVADKNSAMLAAMEETCMSIWNALDGSCLALYTAGKDQTSMFAPRFTAPADFIPWRRTDQQAALAVAQKVFEKYVPRGAVKEVEIPGKQVGQTTLTPPLVSNDRSASAHCGFAGRTLVVGLRTGEVKLFDFDRAFQWEYKPASEPGFAPCVAISHDARYVVAAGYGTTFDVINAQSGQLVTSANITVRTQKPLHKIKRVIFKAGDSRTFYVATEAAVLEYYIDGDHVNNGMGHDITCAAMSSVRDICVDAAGSILVGVAGSESQVQLIESDGESSASVAKLVTVDALENKHRYFGANEFGEVYFDDDMVATKLPAYASVIGACSLAAGRFAFATATKYCVATSGGSVTELEGHLANPRGICRNLDGTVLVTWTHDSIRLWNVTSSEIRPYAILGVQNGAFNNTKNPQLEQIDF